MVGWIFRDKKGQLKIQEMAFVLLALVLLAALVFMFSIRLQSQKIKGVVEEVNQQRALSLRDKLSALPELKCARTSCIDEDRARILNKYDVGDLFQGLSGARIVQIYPENKEIILYSTNRQVNASYSTFVNLCEQKLTGTAFEYDCGLALLLVSV